MKTKEPNNELIIAEYEKADLAGRKILITLYGEEMFAPKITDSVIEFEEICKKGGVNPSDVLRFANPINSYQEGKNAEDMLDVLYANQVGDYEPNWDDGNVRKWIPIFIMGAAFRSTLRLAVGRMRIRMAALAFGFQQKKWQQILENATNHCIKRLPTWVNANNLYINHN